MRGTIEELHSPKTTYKMETYLTFSNLAIAVTIPYLLTFFFWKNRKPVVSIAEGILFTVIANAVASIFLFVLIILITNGQQNPGGLASALCPCLLLIIGVPFLMVRLLSY